MNLGDISALLRSRPAGHSLPQGFYNSAAAFEFDLAAIFGTSWLFVGFEAEIKRPGDYLSFLVGRWPVIVVHGRDGALRAFHNSCRHRGSILCKPGQGSAARIVCPYHSWTYGLDGRLLAASRMPADFEKSAHGLKPVHLERIAGALFLCLADTPPDISVMRRELTPLLAPHNLEHAKLAYQSTLIEYANWKLVMENGRECYHCASGHPELSNAFPVHASAYFDLPDNSAARFEQRMADIAMPVGPVGEAWWQAVRFPLNDGAVAMTTTGQFSVGKLMCAAGDGNIGSLRWAVEPNNFCHSTSEYTFAFSAIPVSPTETHVVSKWLVHEDAVEGVDYDLPTLTHLWTQTNLQDKEFAENNQLGVNSPGYSPGPYSPDAESLTLRFVDWYCDRAAAYIGHAV
ncbi:aromatic ring-hydroxylating oxygenase subunit alpha [Sphingomonas sp. PAMC 26605]|uniref:aromatic ring-hydroxylating oxygenase subunit alpha n=1 Tax=Sphingomonas sp. PAMC 26605 TaxID=1112214 RepID=UPI00026CDE05|nr:aromatic ring-hydroxylating dioxygenase subunit alpha [Sphingomonas sp. PAMC 26605]